MSKYPQLKPVVDLPRMLGRAHAMVSDAIACYVARDAKAAREIILRDDEVDSLYLQIFRVLLTYMIEDPKTISRAIDLILVARFIERIADQATNIAEEVVYLVEAKPIRHGYIPEEE
jgi:phosphate transport system protein